MRCVRAATTLAAAMLASISSAATTQQLRGVIRDSATAYVIAGAVASLFDASNRPIARTIADEQGRYRLSAPESAVRLQILRIGYRPRDIRLPANRGDSVLTIDVSMSPVPKFLSAVRVSDRAVCPERESGGEALGLWEQARAGLLATVVARTERQARVRNVLYQREIDARSGKIVSQTMSRSSGVSSQPFIASRPAHEFARYGYMVEDAGGRTYFAPDADVLLDPTFMTAHCFRIEVDDRRHGREIGLAFIPAPGRDTIVDVAGVLWLDRTTLDLRTMEFHYTGLEPVVTPKQNGGFLAFRGMPNGVVFIERWSILMPLLERRVARNADAQLDMPRHLRRDVSVSELHESGGELARATWPDAQWQATLGSVKGRVVERGTGRPLKNVQVWLGGTYDAGISDSVGAFTFEELVPGPYTLKAADTVLAEFEISQSKTLALDVQREQPLTVTLEWRTLDDVMADLCRDERGPPGAAVLGRTRNADGSPRSDVTFAAAWQADIMITASGEISFRRISRTGRSDEKGVFHLCNVPREQRIGVRATFAPQVFKDTSLVVGRDQPFTLLRITRP